MRLRISLACGCLMVPLSAAKAQEPAPVSPPVDSTQASTAPDATTRPTPVASSEVSDEGGIVVTARKRAESLQNISLAVTAVSGDLLRDQQINNLKDLQHLVPSITLGDDNNIAKLSIRGIGLNTSINGAEAGVSLYVDGAVVSRPEAQFASLFDLDRVEVLRGPQGTLYGRNAVGGAINLITAKPTDYFTGYLNVTYGNYDMLNVEGAVSGPLTSTLSARLAVKSEDRGGFGKWVGTNQDIDDDHRQMARLEMLWKPTDNFDWLVSGEWFRQDDHSGAPHKGPIIFVNPANPGVSLLVLSGIGGYPERARDIGSDYLPTVDAMTWAATSTMNLQVSDALSFTNITNYRDFHTAWSYDLDGSNVRNSVQTTGRSIATGAKYVGSKQFSTEFQLKLDTEFIKGASGFFYFDEHQTGHNDAGVWNTTQLGSDRNLDVLEANNIDPLLALKTCHLDQYAFNPRRADGRPNPVPNLCGWSQQDTKAFAVYSQYLIDLGILSPSLSTLTVKLGGRYSHESREVDNPGVSINASAPVATIWLPGEKHARRSFADFTPEVGVEWHPSHNIMAYYTYSEGFKSGVAENNPGDPTIVGPETIKNHEIGLKSSFLNNRVTLNLAAYKYDLYGLQVQRSVQACSGCTPVQVFENATAVRGKGAELEMLARIGKSLRVNGSVSYLDSKYKDYVTFDGLDWRNVTGPTTLGNIAPAVQLAGNPTRNSPKWTLTGGAEFDIPFPLFKEGVLTPRMDVLHRSTVYYSDFKRLIEGQKPYTMIDASLKYSSSASSLTITAWVKNLTNELVVSGTWPLRTGGIIGNFYYPPRTYGVTAGYKF